MHLTEKDRHFLILCEQEKKKSHDPERQVGAVIVNIDGTIIATGSNRPPKTLNLSVEDSHLKIASNPEWKYYLLEHAERNAIYEAAESSHSLVGATMYGTLFPCADCARAIVASGIKRLVVPAINYRSEENNKWQTHYQYSQEIFKLANTEVNFIDP
tara:strand:- start:10193 stop:10663 length:471 start_codon:yes stop_codon:yes gene_type:complete